MILLDTMGELASLYAVADVIFVGGSLVPIGGHNVVEPALHAKAVVFGPHMTNFRDAAALLLRADAAIQVKDGAELTEALGRLLGDAPGRAGARPGGLERGARPPGRVRSHHRRAGAASWRCAGLTAPRERPVTKEPGAFRRGRLLRAWREGRRRPAGHRPDARGVGVSSRVPRAGSRLPTRVARPRAPVVRRGLRGEPCRGRHREDADGGDGGALAHRGRAPRRDPEPRLRSPSRWAGRARVRRWRAEAVGRAGRRRATAPGAPPSGGGRRGRGGSARGGAVGGQRAPAGRRAARRRLPAASPSEGRGDRLPGRPRPVGSGRALSSGHAPRAAVRSRAGGSRRADAGRRAAEPRRLFQEIRQYAGAAPCLAADYAIEGLRDLHSGAPQPRDAIAGARRPRLRGHRRPRTPGRGPRRVGSDRARGRRVSGSPPVHAPRPRRGDPAGSRARREPPRDDGKGRGAARALGAGAPGGAFLPVWVLGVRLEAVTGAPLDAWRAALRAGVERATREGRAGTRP